MLHQQMGKLRDCENKYEVEEQLDKSDLAVTVTAAGSQEASIEFGPGRMWYR